MKRVLHCVSGFNYGGIEAMLLQYTKQMDPQEYIFDVLTFSAEEEQKSKMEELGSAVIVLQAEEYRNPLRFIQSVRRVLRSNTYCAVHSHIGYLSFVPLFAARCERIPIRIAHSHAADSFEDLSVKWKLVYIIGRMLNPLLATQYVACSSIAAKAAFGNSSGKNGLILKNAIDTHSFRDVDQMQVNGLRKELGIPDKGYIVGNIGYVGYHKNQRFILELAEELKEEEIYWLLIGDGAMYEEHYKVIQEKGLSKVKMLGVRKDIPALLHLLDLFILPSIREGLGIVAIEAQASGTPCLVSRNVPIDIDLGLNMVEFIPLTKELWVSKVAAKPQKSMVSSESILKNVACSGYEIEFAAKELLHIYEQ